jgi:hypothetical protein
MPNKFNLLTTLKQGKTILEGIKEPQQAGAARKIILSISRAASGGVHTHTQPVLNLSEIIKRVAARELVNN